MYDNNSHQDDPRPIPIGRYGRPAPPPKRSWTQATKLFLGDHKVGLLAKFATRYLPVGFLPVGVFDNVTGIGVADDPLTVAFFLWVLYKINRYRNPANDK